jgi:hypothetical protein
MDISFYLFYDQPIIKKDIWMTEKTVLFLPQ